MNETRFQSAVSNVRPRGVRVIEAYSPRHGRRLQCFGEHVFGQWIRMEAYPTVRAFCERPAYLDPVGKHFVDFWVLQEDLEVLLITGHLGDDKSGDVTNSTANTRNGHSTKTLNGDFGALPLDVPRDRQGTFEPQIVVKNQTRWAGFDDKIISLYARGLSVREIQSHLEEMYGTEVSPTHISNVTDAVREDVKLWQARPLDAVYPILYLDCIHVKVRDSGAVRTKAVYLAIGVNMEGRKEVLGLWSAQNEGAKFWLQVVTELKNRGVQDIFIACVDGLKGFPQAIEAVYPQATVQLCIVHMVRNSLNFVPWKAQKEVAADLKLIYGASTAEEAELRLSEFENKWDKQYKPTGQSWRRN